MEVYHMEKYLAGLLLKHFEIWQKPKVSTGFIPPEDMWVQRAGVISGFYVFLLLVMQFIRLAKPLVEYHTGRIDNREMGYFIFTGEAHRILHLHYPETISTRLEESKTTSQGEAFEPGVSTVQLTKP